MLREAIVMTVNFIIVTWRESERFRSECVYVLCVCVKDVTPISLPMLESEVYS